MTRKTNEERLSVIETKLDKLIEEIKEIRDDYKGLVLVIDKKYATTERVAKLEKAFYWTMGVVGSVAGAVFSYLLLMNI